MTFLETKRYLNKSLYLEDLIKANREELKHLHENLVILKSIDYSTERVQGGSGKTNEDIHCEILDDIEEIENKISRDILEMTKLQKKISTLIDEIDDSKIKAVMKYKYLCGLTLTETAEKLDISFQWASVLHNRGIQRIQTLDTAL